MASDNPQVQMMAKAPVVVEHSDERLAAVEEAKRTGEEFRSVGSNGQELVAKDDLHEALVEFSNDQAVEGTQLPEYLDDLMEQADPTPELNHRKAQEHNEYSHRLASRQREAQEKAQQVLREDPYAIAREVAERNKKVREEYEQRTNEFARAAGRESQEVVFMRPERASDPSPATAMGKNAGKVPDISETFAKDALEVKDRIIYGAESFKAQATRSTEEVDNVPKVRKSPKAKSAPRNDSQREPKQEPNIKGSGGGSGENDDKGENARKNNAEGGGQE